MMIPFSFGCWNTMLRNWQRASVDAVIVVAAVFGLFAFARSLEKFEARHFPAFAVLLVVLAGFAVVLYLAGNHLAEVAGPTLENLESDSSP
jgi:predicted membrane-bound dolichyl-phosphate-mannose-protein mannosyltransferase